MNTQQISACRLELPTFFFVDIYKIPKEIKQQQVFSSFTVEDLENKVTANSITEALENADLIK